MARGFSGPNPSPAQFHFPTEADWQRELADATGPQPRHRLHLGRKLVRTDRRRNHHLRRIEDATVQTCTLDDRRHASPNPSLLEALQERIFVLTELELRAHPSWHPILELYRSALTALVNDNTPDRGEKTSPGSPRQRVAEMANHQKLLDYINWFEVTKDYRRQRRPAFSTYFTTAKEMERVQADPAHPNPIRANLLQIESEL